MIERTCIIFNIRVIGWRTGANNDALVSQERCSEWMARKTQGAHKQASQQTNKQAKKTFYAIFIREVYLIKITISLWMIHDHIYIINGWWAVRKGKSVNI